MELEKHREEAPLTRYLNQKDQPIKQFMEKEITEEEIEKAINKLATRKAAGDDEITGEIIKQNKDWIKKAIHIMIQRTEEAGRMNRKWVSGTATFI